MSSFARLSIVAVCAAMLLNNCSATTGSGSPTQAGHKVRPPASTAVTPSPSEARTSSPTARPASPAVSKVLVFVVENHSLDQMRTQMPNTFSLAQWYAYTTAYHALVHPSLGNYIAIAGGSTFGIADDRKPVAHQLHGPSVFSQALDAGKTAAAYAEGMPGNCVQNDGGARYVVRHNPWTYFVDDRPACSQYDVPATRLSSDIDDGTLPNVGMVVPNLCNDAHDCSLATADTWLSGVVGHVMAGPDWKSGRLAVVVTADEDDRHQGNLVLTTVMHPSLEHVVDGTALTHLSLSRFLSEVVGQPPLRDAAGARSLGDTLGLRVDH